MPPLIAVDIGNSRVKLGLFDAPATGPGSLAIRDALSAPAQRGFNAAVTLHLGRHY